MNGQESIPPIRARIAWGAIIAGALFSVAALLVMGSFAGILELSETYESGTGSLQFLAFTITIIALFLGGFATVRLEAGETLAEGLFHAVLVWSVVACLLIYLGLNGFIVSGTSIILGQPTDPFQGFLTRQSAAWAFAGVLFSLLAALLGSYLGMLKIKTKSDRRAEIPQKACLDP